MEKQPQPGHLLDADVALPPAVDDDDTGEDETYFLGKKQPALRGLRPATTPRIFIRGVVVPYQIFTSHMVD